MTRTIFATALFMLIGSAAAAQSAHPTTGAGHHHGTTSGHGDALPSQIDPSLSKPSNMGHYQVSIAPRSEPVVINTLHSWVLAITTPDGQPVADAVVAVDGGMPRHGHGLPTAPQVTSYLGDGRYLVEGVRFNMAGWWAVKFDIAAPRADSVHFNISLE